jgi:DNA-3-methyladenine glycosylase I
MIEGVTTKRGCDWPGNDPLMIHYHDHEWGVPLRDDQKLFEFITLDAFQAGLSWKTILQKREAFRRAFDRFDPKVISLYDDQKIESLLSDEGIIRNRLKIVATIGNARAFLELVAAFGSFHQFIWQFTGNRTILNHWEDLRQIPVSSKESDQMSKSLKERGFKFVGSTICYAFMQAAGMVNDHTVHCFRHHEINQLSQLENH